MLSVLYLLQFTGRDQVQKSVQQSMALPQAQPLLELWRYKEFSALGSNDVDDNDPHHPPLSKGQFLSFLKPQMRFYEVSPQSFFWFKAAIEKATNEMFSEVGKMKESVDQEDIQQSMNFIQNCLHLQFTTVGC